MFRFRVDARAGFTETDWVGSGGGRRDRCEGIATEHASAHEVVPECTSEEDDGRSGTGQESSGFESVVKSRELSCVDDGVGDQTQEGTRNGGHDGTNGNDGHFIDFFFVKGLG